MLRNSNADYHHSVIVFFTSVEMHCQQNVITISCAVLDDSWSIWNVSLPAPPIKLLRTTPYLKHCELRFSRPVFIQRQSFQLYAKSPTDCVKRLVHAEDKAPRVWHFWRRIRLWLLNSPWKVRKKDFSSNDVIIATNTYTFEHCLSNLHETYVK